MQRVKWLFLPFLFVFYINLPLYANSFKDILFEPAIAEFKLDDKNEDEVYISRSNYVKINIEDTNKTKPNQPTLSFYRYDPKSDSYLGVSKTYYQPDENPNTEFNPMTPLVLESGEKIDISKKLPAIKCQIFRRNEPLIIVYSDNNLSNSSSIELDITTDKDRERIKLIKGDEDSSLFVGYINTTTKCLSKCDGTLYVEKGTEIKASLVEYSKKSRSSTNKIFAIAGVEHVVFETKAEIKQKKEAQVWVEIKSNKIVASVGEFIRYDITLENLGEKDIKDALLVSELSLGLKYKLGAKKRKIDLLKAKEKRTITYIASVDIDAKDSVKNRVYLLYDKKSSNQSSNEIKIEQDFDDKSTIIGRIKLDNSESNISLSGIKFYLEDGRYTVSDRYGKFHFQDIKPSTHVVSIDPDTLDGRFTLLECKEDNLRALGSKTSYFVNTRDSHIKRVTFCLKQNRLLKDIKSTFTYKMSDKKSEGMPEFGYADFDKYKSGFIWPKEGYVPPMPSIKVAFLHKTNEKLVLYLNGKKVDMLNYDGAVKSRDKKFVISKYRGIDIVDGDNILEAKVGSKLYKRKIHLSTSPVKAVILKDRSTLVADGKNPIIIAVKLIDSSGYPLREGMVGKYTVDEPYVPQERLDILRENPLANVASENIYSVSKDGIAYIYLQPTSKSGEVKLHFPFQNSNEYSKVWLNAKAREWLIVGFAKGSVGYETIKNEMKKSNSNELVTDKKVSLFAKGKISSDTLLTIAYDSQKSASGLIQEQDLESEYLVYADSTIQKNETPSSKKLYLKIEKDSFYALFGDFDTGFDTELSKYTRRLNGLKSEFHGDMFEYNAFITQSNKSFRKDEIQGDGTSGLYHLKSKDIVVGSQRVYIEVRDRYRDEIIISKKPLLPVYDYNIDYFAGTIYFKEPILKRDRDGNPRFIVVEYEVEDGKSERYTYGGRGAMKFFNGVLEFGATALGEDKFDGVDTLYGFDAKINASDNIVINAEYAQSRATIDTNKTTANAYLVELSHHNRYADTKLYFKKQEEGFGFSQQNSSQSATQKYGVDTTINYFKHVALKLSAYGDKSLKTGERKDSIEALSEYRRSGYLAALGYRYQSLNSNDSKNSQIISRISKGFFDNKLKLSAAYEFSIDGKSDEFYDRTFAEASYFVNQYVEIFANHEIQEGLTKKSDISRVGVKGRPWRGASIESSISQEFENDLPRLFGGMGINQNWQINKKLTLLASLEREQTLKGDTADKDYTAYALGATYRDGDFVYSTKGEYRTSDSEKKINLDLSAYTEVNENLGLSFGARVFDTKTKEDSSQDAELKFSLAKREENYLLIEQLKYLYTKESNEKVSKAISSLMFEIYPLKDTTLSAHYGLKYTQDQIDNKRYSSFIDTAGFELIHELNRRLELGFLGSFIHSYETNSIDESLGVYVGYNIFKNSWLGFGYNFSGFKDDDFSSLRWSQQGAYIRFFLKFDQESLEDLSKFAKW
jgi:uncharacterized repeat protein (TIGR01451 family)